MGPSAKYRRNEDLLSMNLSVDPLFTLNLKTGLSRRVFVRLLRLFKKKPNAILSFFI